MTGVAPLLATLPPGVGGLARALWSDACARLEAMGESRLRPEGLDLDRVLTFGARRADPPPAAPGRPSWLHADVRPEDADVLDALLADLGPDDPEAVAAAAQELRLPVTPYRTPEAAAGRWPGPAEGLRPPATTGARPGGLASALVLDLTTHWAGPLCTRLLAASGVTVVKVDPSCRPDGFRSNPRLYRPLNRAKLVVDLDLRRSEDRRAFEGIVARADLVVESFSDRVMGNLGYDPDALRAVNPRLSTLALRAFPSGSPEASWVAYGRGVHAASGLGLAGGVPAPAAVAYPDPLAGLAAFSAALDALASPTPARSYEVSLAGVLRPLVLRAAPVQVAA